MKEDDQISNRILDKAKFAKNESKQIDFKSSFDLFSTESWCEILKDVVAMAYSGGGMIIFGISDNGSDADFAKKIILELDPIKITDQVEKYTGENFSAFEIIGIKRGRKYYAALLVKSGERSIIFTKHGN